MLKKYTVLITDAEQNNSDNLQMSFN